MLFFIAAYEEIGTVEEYLNTSHVILYPLDDINRYTEQKFKYISCYSLSEEEPEDNFMDANLNTSHVILYHHGAIRILLNGAYLNTSHVILYLYCWDEESTEDADLNTSHVILYQRF